MIKLLILSYDKHASMYKDDDVKMMNFGNKVSFHSYNNYFNQTYLKLKEKVSRIEMDKYKR